jgi:hypothetical protein
MNEFEDLLRVLDTGLNRKTPLLHPFDSLLAELSPPTADSSLLRRTIRRRVGADCGHFVGYYPC